MVLGKPGRGPVSGDGFDGSLSVDNDMEGKTGHTNSDLHYAVQLVHATCCLAGSASYLDDIRTDLRDCGITRAIKDHDTPVLFDWLVEALSFQGISDSVAAEYIEQHGNVRWADVAEGLSRTPSCPKLAGYWRFYGCRYHKGSGTCGEPGHIDACPLPRHPLRNGRLNQMAYSLFLFMRDVADNDFVGWIDSQLRTVNSQSPNRLAALREAIIGPLRNVYGVSDKVLAMALSNLLLGAGKRRPLWLEVGATFVAVDTLVHNFLHRTGSCSGSAPTTRTETGATGPEGAPGSSIYSQPTSTHAGSIPPSRQDFRGSCRVRSGGIVPRMALMSAMAIGSTTTPVVTTGIASCFGAVIA
jgi:hypothetical protein